MTEPVLTTQYPSLKSEHLEIIPIFSNKILYQDVPTHIPNLTLEEKKKFLDAVLKTFDFIIVGTYTPDVCGYP